MNPSPAQLCIVAMFVLNTVGLVCYFIERRDHCREVAELTIRAEAPTHYTFTAASAAGLFGPKMVSEEDLMAAYLKLVGSTSKPGTTVKLLRIRR